MGLRDLGRGLYDGNVSYDFVGRRKTWYLISAIILIVAVGSLVFRGLNFGIEFEGGSEFRIPNAQCSVEDARTVTESQVDGQAIVTLLGEDTIRVQTVELTPAESNDVTAALGEACNVPPADIQIQLVGATWGSDISTKALQGLVVFLVLVTIFLAIYFEWRMAIAALVALAHDIVITIGIYALIGFEVTPATVIGVLTILGYSLYDTVVVFDKVKENTRGIAGQSKITYSQAANLAVNQTLVRSINTSIIALLPVSAILFVGAGLLGAGTLKDLAVALFVGIAAGTYSSIFVATPLLAQMKENDPEMKALAKRVAARGSAAATPDQVAKAGRSIASTNAGTATTAEDLPAAQVAVSSGDRVQPKRAPKSKRKRKRK